MKPNSPKKLKRKDHKRIEGDNILRYPRPLGITYLNLTEQNKDKIKDRIIELYVSNNFQLNNKSIQLNELAQYLNIPTTDILRRINKTIERVSGMFEGRDGKALARGLFVGMVKKSLEICALTQQQLGTLMAQQGGEYVPFLTGETNRAMTNLINAQKPVQELMKMMLDKAPVNLILNVNGESETSGKHYLSPEEARMLIQDSGPSLIGNKLLLEAKEAELGSLPDVNARNQDLSTIGVRIPKKVQGTDEQNSSTIPNEIHDDHTFIG